jgi:hypothetical protein
LRHERDVDAHQPGHVGCNAIIEREAHGRPSDRYRREHGRQNQLVGSPVDEPIQLQRLAVRIALDQIAQVIPGLGRQSAERARDRTPIRSEYDDEVRIYSSALILDGGQQRRRIRR